MMECAEGPSFCVGRGDLLHLRPRLQKTYPPVSVERSVGNIQKQGASHSTRAHYLFECIRTRLVSLFSLEFGIIHTVCHILVLSSRNRLLGCREIQMTSQKVGSFSKILDTQKFFIFLASNMNVICKVSVIVLRFSIRIFILYFLTSLFLTLNCSDIHKR